MLKATEFAVDTELVTECSSLVHSFKGFKTSINEPTKNFFYDPWIVKEQYQGTAFEKILNKLPFSIGEARIIALSPMHCYTQHADIDDRYHLNISGNGGYLLDLVDNKIYPTVNDGIWYLMDTGRLHTAVSCGEKIRYQLVVRKLLTRNRLQDPLNVQIYLEGENPRFSFDNHVSPWLNYANKKSILTNFSVIKNKVSFFLERSSVNYLRCVIPNECRLEINEY
jgi:hypothetical protein